MGHLGVVLYEYLGEEYPEVLGSILGALKVIQTHKKCVFEPDMIMCYYCDIFCN